MGIVDKLLVAAAMLAVSFLERLGRVSEANKLRGHLVGYHLTHEEESAGVVARQRIDLVSVMITLVVAGVVGFVGIDVMSSTRESTSLSEGDAFYNASSDLATAVGNAWSQMGTVFTVIILVVVVSYLIVLRGR